MLKHSITFQEFLGIFQKFLEVLEQVKHTAEKFWKYSESSELFGTFQIKSRAQKSVSKGSVHIGVRMGGNGLPNSSGVHSFWIMQSLIIYVMLIISKM